MAVFSACTRFRGRALRACFLVRGERSLTRRAFAGSPAGDGPVPGGALKGGMHEPGSTNRRSPRSSMCSLNERAASAPGGSVDFMSCSSRNSLNASCSRQSADAAYFSSTLTRPPLRVFRIGPGAPPRPAAKRGFLSATGSRILSGFERAGQRRDAPISESAGSSLSYPANSSNLPQLACASSVAKREPISGASACRILNPARVSAWLCAPCMGRPKRRGRQAAFWNEGPPSKAPASRLPMSFTTAKSRPSTRAGAAPSLDPTGRMAQAALKKVDVLDRARFGLARLRPARGLFFPPNSGFAGSTINAGTGKRDTIGKVLPPARHPGPRRSGLSGAPPIRLPRIAGVRTRPRLSGLAANATTAPAVSRRAVLWLFPARALGWRNLLPRRPRAASKRCRAATRIGSSLRGRSRLAPPRPVFSYPRRLPPEKLGGRARASRKRSPSFHPAFLALSYLRAVAPCPSEACRSSGFLPSFSGADNPYGAIARHAWASARPPIEP